MANMDEFACGSSGETSYYGPTQNPAAPGRIPGGSSSGPAAAVAAGFADCALGTDTGGSIRNPASHCGITGFKPTYGVVSRYGLIDLAMSLDQVGPLAKDTATCAKLLEAIAGHDEKDATSLTLDRKFYAFSGNLNPSLKDVRVGYAREFDELIGDKGIKQVIHSALDKMSSAGAQITDVSLPNLGIAIPTYYLNVYVEFFSGTRKYDGRRYGHRIEESCGEEVLRRILLGSYISQKEYSGRFYRKDAAGKECTAKRPVLCVKGRRRPRRTCCPKAPTHARYKDRRPKGYVCIRHIHRRRKPCRDPCGRGSGRQGGWHTHRPADNGGRIMRPEGIGCDGRVRGPAGGIIKHIFSCLLSPES